MKTADLVLCLSFVVLVSFSYRDAAPVKEVPEKAVKTTVVKTQEVIPQKEATVEDELQDLKEYVGEDILTKSEDTKEQPAEDKEQSITAQDASSEEEQSDKSKSNEKKGEEKRLKNMPVIATRGGSNVVENKDSVNLADQETPVNVDFDLTPQAVAEYLLITGDFEGFELAIQDLLGANILSEREVGQYKDMVSYEYQNLLTKLVDSETQYLQEIAAQEAPYFERNQVKVPNPQATVSLDTPNVDVSNALRKMQIASMLEKEASVNNLLQQVLADYYDVPETEMNEQDPKEEEEMMQVIELLKNAIDQGYPIDIPNDLAGSQEEAVSAEQPEVEKAVEEDTAEKELDSIAELKNEKEEKTQEDIKKPEEKKKTPEKRSVDGMNKAENLIM